MAAAFSRSAMTCVCPFALASSNAVLPPCRRGSEGRGGGGGGRRGGRGRGLWAARRGGAAPTQGPFPLNPTPRPSPPRPLTPPSSALCAIAHLVLEARVGPRLEQRLDAGRVAVAGRFVQRRHLALPRRGGGRTHAGERRRRAGRWCLKAEGEGRRGLGGEAGGAALTSFVASSLAPLAMRNLRQSSLPC